MLPAIIVTGPDGIKRVKYDDLIPLIIEAIKDEKANFLEKTTTIESSIFLLNLQMA
jgi:hypothetical protein